MPTTPLEKSWKDARTRNQMAQQNQKLVHLIARRMSATCREPYEDLYQIGYVGLLKACDRFTPESGNAFSSFAVPYIQGEIQHFLRDQWQAIKIPRSILESRAKVKRLKRSLDRLGRELGEKEIALGLGYGEDVMEVNANLTCSLDEMLHEPISGEEEEEVTLMSAIAKLPAKQKAAILEYFWANYNIEEMAKNHHQTPQEMKARLNRGLNKLRKEISNA